MKEFSEILPEVIQSPNPGTSHIMYCGDCVSFTLNISNQTAGRAWMRTDLRSAGVTRQEIIQRVEKNEIKLDSAWYDIEMRQESNTVFKIVLPLHQTGFFHAKCFVKV